MMRTGVSNRAKSTDIKALKPVPVLEETPKSQSGRASTGVTKNVLTIDLEDWFHVSNFENYLDRNSWDQLPSRIPYTHCRVYWICCLSIKCVPHFSV
jgi:hypothetical protein